MEDYKSKLSNLKFKTKAQFDDFIYENSTKSVLKVLKENGIEASELCDDEMNLLIAEEVEKQKEFSKGLATGAGGLALLMGFLG